MKTGKAAKIRSVEDVTEDVMAVVWLALGVVDVGGRIDWETVWDRMERIAFHGGPGRLDMGRELDSPAQREIQRRVRGSACKFWGAPDL